MNVLSYTHFIDLYTQNYDLILNALLECIKFLTVHTVPGILAYLKRFVREYPYDI